jgi:hypothetical protein
MNSANANANNNVNVVVGLKTEVKRQVGMKKYEEKVGDYNQKCMVDAWKCLYAVGIRDELVNLIWGHISDQTGYGRVWFKCMSAEVGIRSVIKPYTNDKGITHQAHFSANDKYIGSVSKLGDRPISYDGNFLVNQRDFHLNIDALPNLVVFDGKPLIHHLFVPKGRPNKVAVAPPVAQPEPKAEKKVKKPKAEKKVKFQEDEEVEFEIVDDSDDEPIGNKLKRQNAVRK